ncbi:MAG: beta-galactosidase trimerization domain-containing protein [Lentisphaeria bacterium]|nr:beta-galactosidase trimerization domain-containing protein [Lentisphaeria bacterium]
MKTKYAMFFDFHTGTLIPDVGDHFDVERFTDELRECGVDFLTWHARCNQGNAYYNTKIGRRHPSLKFELFGKIAESCHRKGIRISAYFNGGLSDEELLHNPDWMQISPSGTCLNARRPSAEMRTACYNSPYREHLKAMVRELAENYPVDGFFFDCMSTRHTCVCPVCVKEMKKLGIDYNDPSALREFTGRSVLKLARELYDLIKSIDPRLYFFLNDAWVEEMIGLNTHLECECLPTCPILGYDYLPVQAHYLRTVAGDNSVLCMTGRFYDWGDFGGLRKEESVEYDLLYGMANGMRPEAADHFHPRGDIYPEVFELVRKVYATIRQYDPWCLEAVNRPAVAVVCGNGKGTTLRTNVSLKAAVRMLSELKLQFNVVTTASSWENYELLIFPDNVLFTDEIARRVRAHLERGGAVIATGDSGLDPERNCFVVDSWPVSYQGTTPHDPLYFQPEQTDSEDMPRFPLSVYASGTDVRPETESEISMWCVKPYFNREWDGLHSNWYTPPQEKTSAPFLAFRGKIAYCAGRIFEGYYERAPYQTRMLLRNIIRRFLSRPKFRSASLPSYARAFVQYKDNLELLHVLVYTPELRGKSVALEERGTLIDTDLALRIDGAPFRRVYLAPGKQELNFTQEDEYCRIVLPLIRGYALIVFEK